MEEILSINNSETQNHKKWRFYFTLWIHFNVIDATRKNFCHLNGFGEHSEGIKVKKKKKKNGARKNNH